MPCLSGITINKVEYTAMTKVYKVKYALWPDAVKGIKGFYSRAVLL